MGQIVSLKYDFSFKYLFLNEEVRRHFISDALGFNLDESPEYHRIYRLRDETGNEFSDMLEIHVIELNKQLTGTGRMDDWIRLLNVKTKEELDMLKASTKNIGILEAIKEVRVMSLGKTLRLLYEARQKEIRDRSAREDYVRSEGEDRLNRLYRSLHQDNRHDDLERALRDKEYRKQLYQEYGI